MVLLESIEKGLCVFRRVVVDNIGGIEGIDFIDVFSELVTLLSWDFLNLLECSTLNEGSLCFKVRGQDLCKLMANVG